MHYFKILFRLGARVRQIAVFILLGNVGGAFAADLPSFVGERESFVYTPHSLTRQAPPAPQVAFVDADGKSVTLADFHGKLVVVNFWATWCAPCVAEMQSLDRLADVMRQDVVVLALSQDRGGKAAVVPFYSRQNIRHLSVYLDPRGVIRRALGINALPTTVIYDREGQEVGRLLGTAAWDSPAATAFLKEIARLSAARPRP